MGKANRTKQTKASATLAAAAPRKAGAQKNPPTWVGTLIVILVLAALILFAVFSILNARGTFLRARKVLKSENYEITVPMLSYFTNAKYQEVLANNRARAEQWGISESMLAIGGGEGGDALDSSKSLSAQIYSKTTDAAGNEVVVTWLEYFRDAAATQAKQILVMCEQAKRLGLTLTDEQTQNIEQQLADLKAEAKLYNYSTSGFISAVYGKGVLLKDIRQMMTLSQLAANYAEMRIEECNNAVTDERILAYYQEHQSEFDTYVDFVGYTFTATFTPVENSDDPDAALAENAANKDQYEAEQTKYAARVEALKAAATQTEFTNLLRQYLHEDFLNAEKEKLLADKEPGATLSDLEIADCENRAAESVQTALDEATVENYGDGSSVTVANSDIADWLTSETRAANDTEKWEHVHEVVISGENVYEEADSEYSAYIVTRPNHPSTERSVSHILFKATTYNDLTSTEALTGTAKALADKVLARDGKVTASAMAKELLAEMMEKGLLTAHTEGDKTWYSIKTADFREYGELLTEDSSVDYDEVKKGEMEAGFEYWLFDEDRHIGEISYPDAVETTYGQHLMLYRGEHWYTHIAEEISDSDYEAIVSDLVEKTPITYNAKNLKYVAND